MDGKIIPYFDAHCDTLTEAMEKNLPVNDMSFAAKLSSTKFSKRAQIYAVYGDSKKHDLSGRLERSLEWYRYCEGASKAFFSIEGADVIGCDPKRLKYARELGVKVTGLTWNRANILSGSCVEDTDRGLSEKGYEYISAALEQGMFVDISHMSDLGARKTIVSATGKVMASHSNSRSVCDNPRNLSDYIYLKLVEAGGICGINLYAPFVKKNARATVDDVVEHIRYLSGLSGSVANLCLGCDFDGCDRLPEGIGSAEDLHLLYDALLKAGFTERQTEDIFYYNLYNFMRR